MKKFVLAVGLVAAVTTSYAQTTISGTVGYDITHSGGNTTTGVSDSALSVTAVERIGTTLITAKLGANGLARSSVITGQDALISASNTFGTFSAGQVEVKNGLSSNTYAIVPGIGSDGVVTAGSSDNKVLSYSSPKLFGSTITLTDIQPVLGNAGHTQVVGVNAEIGSVAATADYTTRTDRIRLSGQTSVGAVRLGAGWSGNEIGVPNSFVLAASTSVAPSTTVGISYSNGNGHAYELAGAYSLSKATTFSVGFRGVSDNSFAAANTNTVRVRMQHNF